MNSVNSYLFPVLEEGRFDYNDSCSYSVNQVASGSDGVITLEHHLVGDSFVSQLIKNGDARFACTVVLKSSLYRKTVTVEPNNSTKVLQVVELPKTLEIMDFYPTIVYTGTDREIKVADDMGLSKIWQKSSFDLLQGSILAKESWMELETTAGDLITVVSDDSQREGSFQVEINQQEGGRFVAKVHPDLYANLNNSKGSLHFNSVVTHMLSSGFQKLHDEFQNEDVGHLTNFNFIKKKLEQDSLNPWGSEGFDATLIACYFLPHAFKNTQLDDGYEL